MLVGQAGTWMQKIGQAWLVLQLSDSPLALGSVLSLQALPILCGSLFASVVVDRVSKHRLLLVTQSAALAQAACLAILTVSGRVQLWQVYVLALWLGTVNAFDNPTRLAFVMELVGRQKVVNAVGLNSALENGARLLGPALAGLVIARWGVGVCFSLNAASFLVVLLGLLLMRRGEFVAQPQVQARRRVLSELADGLRFVFGVRELVTVIVVLAGLGCFGYNFNSIVPLMAEQGLHLGADGFGLLMSAVGLGAVVGALVVASAGASSIRRILIAALAFGSVELSLAFTPAFVTAFAQLAIMSFCGMVFSTSCNSTLQLGAPDELRGRVMGLYTLSMAGSTPVGALLTGVVSNAFGIRATVAAWGLACALAAGVAAAYWQRTRPRPAQPLALAQALASAAPGLPAEPVAAAELNARRGRTS